MKGMIRIGAAEGVISWLLVPSVVQAPKALDPTLPMMQHSGILDDY